MMDDHEIRLQKMEAILFQTVNGLGVVGDLIAAQMTITNVVVELVRERLGLDNAEIRERAMALATAAGVDREGVVAQIAAMLPDVMPVAPDAQTRH